MALAKPAHSTVSFDTYTALLTWLALVLAYLGYIDQARSRMDQALSEARRLGHVHISAHVLDTATWIEWLTRSPYVHLEEFMALTAEHDFPQYRGWALAHRGQSLVALAQPREGIALLTQGIAKLGPTGCVTTTSMLYTWLAEAHALLGQSAEKQDCLAEAARIVKRTGERAHEAELLHRVPGDLLNAAGDQSTAEQHYRQAIAVAEKQSAKLFQLRASVSLARLWRDQGRQTEARDLLAPIYGWFTEGFDAPDLKEAKALLDELA